MTKPRCILGGDIRNLRNSAQKATEIITVYSTVLGEQIVVSLNN